MTLNNYNQPYENGIRTKYVTFVQAVTMDGSICQEEQQFKLPGDIPLKVKELRLDIPLKKILTSNNNIVILTVFSAIVIIMGKVLWQKKKP